MSAVIQQSIGQINDEELVKRIKNGDADSLDTLVRNHLPRIYSRVYNFVPESDAEDVTQDIFLSLMDSIESFQGRSTFATWFHRIVMNKVADYHRKVSRRKEYITDEQCQRGFDPWQETEECLIVEEALKEIPEKYSEILSLKFSEDLSFAEIAGKLGLTYEATRSRYRRAITVTRRKIKKSLKDCKTTFD